MPLESDGKFTFTVSLNRPSVQQVSVQYAVDSDMSTAVADTHYEAITPGTVTFAAGDVEESIPVTLIDNAESEGNKSLFLSLSVPVAATLGSMDETGTARSTIRDDEPLVENDQIPDLDLLVNASHEITMEGEYVSLPDSIEAASSNDGVATGYGRAVRGSPERRHRDGGSSRHDDSHHHGSQRARR